MDLALHHGAPSMFSADTTPFNPFPSHDGYLWALIVGFVLAFLLGFGMGANDVANAFGTSVGSKVLSLRMAYFLATIMETLGAVFVGFNVSNTMRKLVIDTKLYEKNPNELLLGQVAILGGGSCWLFLATVLKAPVSTTHSIVGATIGFSLLMRGTEGIHWWKVWEIAASWVLSPLFSGIVSAALYMIVDFAVLRRQHPVKCGLIALPIFYFFCIAFNTFAVTYQGSVVLHINDIPFWIALAISIAFGISASLLVQFVLIPRLLKWINKDDVTSSKLAVISTKGLHSDDTARTNISAINSPTGGINSTARTQNGALKPLDRRQPFELTPKGFFRWFIPHRDRQEDEKTLKLFSSIQVFTACFAGFAHGANDVSNAIAPLAALMSIYKEQSVEQSEPTPLYILSYGVLAICCGLWIMGHRVMKTVGQRMSEINPASGFTIEFGAAVTALCASKIGLPISTTHCLVGSVVSVGTVKSGEGIDWKIFGGIALSWVVTLPISALISAAIMFFLKTFALN
ncbi:phosphate transporter family domain-containing protein [Ditylenchus destructor]|nr:phosphate transporter family domain-containing protein [Ditylenchus destructor]